MQNRQLKTTMPKVFFVIGPAGSGKSSVSKLIAEHYGAVYIDKDTATKRFTELLLTLNGSDPNERDNSEFYQQAILPLEYASILDLSRDNLSIGRSVVLDAPFGKFFADPDYLINAQRAHNWPEAELIVVHVRTDGEAVRERLVARGYERDEWKLNNWEQFWAASQANACQWKAARHVVLDNSGDAIDVELLDRAIAVGADVPPADAPA